MTNAKNNFGRSITHAEANDYFLRYVEVKRKYGEKLREFLKDDPNAQRFFCGRHGAAPEMEDWAFVFDPESVKRLKEVMDSSGANAIIIFQGIRNKESIDPADESDGRPTLLLFPAFYSEKEGNGNYDISNMGEEHPGTGGGTPPPPLGTIGLPTSLSLDQIHPFALQAQ